MELENIAQILIYLHAATGGLALISGGIALIVKKGSSIHKKSGKVFYYTMLTSAILAFVIAVLPGHQSAFLFSVGAFSVYFLVAGYRSLNFRKKELDLTVDKGIAYAIIVVGIIMILYPIILKGELKKMTGGYIAAVSAFFVVNEILPGIWNWFVPGIVGGVYITYWMLKLNKYIDNQISMIFFYNGIVCCISTIKT